MKKCFRLKPIALGVALCLGSSAAMAQVVAEVEPNDTYTTAQRLVITDPVVTVTAWLGDSAIQNTTTTDLDFYSFEAAAGDTVYIDIDNGWAGAEPGFDSYIVLYRPDGSQLASNDNNWGPEDINGGQDAAINNQLLSVAGVYTVGVTTSSRSFDAYAEPGTVSGDPGAGGDYSLVIYGVSATAGGGSGTGTGGGTGEDPGDTDEDAPLAFEVDFKPGVKELVKLNPKSRQHFKAALLSSDGFDATQVDPTSLTFGRNGDEKSADSCKKDAKDFNHDGRPDLVCFFSTAGAGFEDGDTMGVVKGKLKNKKAIRGQGELKVYPKGKGPKEKKVK